MPFRTSVIDNPFGCQQRLPTTSTTAAFMDLLVANATSLVRHCDDTGPYALE
jgi:hypothetical protein